MTTFKRHSRAHSARVALACGVLYGALIVASFGFASLATNTDVVRERGIGVFVGPLMAVVAIVALTLMLLLRSPREGDDGLDWGYSLLVGGSSTVSYILAAFVIGVIDQGVSLGWQFGLVTLTGGYDALVGILGFGVALLYSFIIARRYDEHGRPRWSWEDDFDV